MSKAEDDFIKLARDRFDQSELASNDQRQREKDDLAFYAGEQWDAEQKAARAGMLANNGLPPVPARPTLTINKVREPVRQVLNSEEQSDFTIEIIAADDFGTLVENSEDNETEIELREGLLRRIQRAPEAEDARMWAGSRAAIAGTGWYRVMTRFVSGKTWDKEIAPERIYNQSSVSADPAHEQPDGSDAEWILDGVDMPIDRYEAEFGKIDGKKNRVVQCSDNEWRALGEEAPKWFTSDGKTRSIRVMNYWYTERETKTLCLLEDGTSGWQDELPKDVKCVDKREVTEKRIKWAKIDGVQILDETDWEGPDMPYVKVLGEELHPYDDDRRTEGMVRPMRDSGKAFNSLASKFIETVGLSPIPTVMLEEGTDGPYKAWWQLAATRTLPYLLYKSTNLEGVKANPPMTVPRESQIQEIAMGLQVFDEAIKSTTGVPESNMGHQDPTVKSGKMVQALIAQSQLGTSHFMENLRRSMRYEGQIINNLLYPIYGKRPGRLARIVTGEGESMTVPIGAPQPQQNGMPPAPQQKNWKLTPDANFNVVVNIVKDAGTLREQETAIVGHVIEAQPELMGVFGDLFFKHQDGPGHKEMAERMEVMLNPKVQAFIEQKKQGGPQIPPQVMAEMAQQKQQLDDAHQLLQKAAGELQSKQAENDTKIRITQMELESKERIAQADRETKLAVAELGAKVDRLTLFLEERARLGVQDHDAHQANIDRAHDVAMAAQGHQQAMQAGEAQAGIQAGQQAAQQSHEIGQQATQQEHEAEQARMAQEAAQQASVDNATA